MVIAHAELMSVGPDEIVVTGTSAPGVEVLTRVGDAEVTTTGPFHNARITGLEPDTDYALVVEGATPRPVAARACAHAGTPHRTTRRHPRHRQRRALRRDRVWSYG